MVARVARALPARINMDLTPRLVGEINELARRARRNHDYIAGFHFSFLITRHAGRASLLHDDDLIAIVPMQFRRAAWRRVHEKKRIATPCFSPTNSCDIP